MSVKRRVGWRGPATIAFVLATLSASAIGPMTSALAAPTLNNTSLYLVQFAGAPLSTYSGDVAGFAATKPAKGKKINTHTANAVGYSKYLTDRQHSVLNSAGVSVSNVTYTFTTAVNGAAVNLSAAQAAKLARTPGVVMIEKNRIQTIQETETPQPPTPAFLGLTGKNGVWNSQFGGSLSFVGQSAGSSAEESVTLNNPSGNYVMFVNAFASPSGSVTAKANTFVVPNSAVGNLTATPAAQSVTIGHSATVTLNWTGLASGHYLGIVNYSDGTNPIGSTIVDITN
jgi:peptidase inhibitor I9